VLLAATANVPETVLDGTVARVDGELAEVDTAVGTVRGPTTTPQSATPCRCGSAQTR